MNKPRLEGNNPLPIRSHKQRLRRRNVRTKYSTRQPISDSSLGKIDNSEQEIDPNAVAAQFLKFCLRRDWLRQKGTGDPGTRWYATPHGKVLLKKSLGIDI
jgi:hypothetical protein